MQGIVRKGVNNVTVQFEKLGYVANNLANMNTNGYKSVTFEQILKEDGYLTGSVRSDFRPGSIKITSNPYDVAIALLYAGRWRDLPRQRHDRA